MADETAEARQRVADARRGASSELDTLGSSTRAALDFPAKVRRHPVETVGVLGGLAFLVLGGPRRVAKSTERRFFPERPIGRRRCCPRKSTRRSSPCPRKTANRFARTSSVTSRPTSRRNTSPTRARAASRSGRPTTCSLASSALPRRVSSVKKALTVPAEARVEQAKEDAKAAEEITASGSPAAASPERAAKR